MNTNTVRHVLPSKELGPDTLVPFCNGDDSAALKNLTRPEVALLAFESVFSDDAADYHEEHAVTSAGER